MAYDHLTAAVLSPSSQWLIYYVYMRDEKAPLKGFVKLMCRLQCIYRHILPKLSYFVSYNGTACKVWTIRNSNLAEPTKIEIPKANGKTKFFKSTQNWTCLKISSESIFSKFPFDSAMFYQMLFFFQINLFLRTNLRTYEQRSMAFLTNPSHPKYETLKSDFGTATGSSSVCMYGIMYQRKK